MKPKETNEQILARVFSEKSNELTPAHDPTPEFPFDWLPPEIETRLAPLPVEELRARILAHGGIESILAVELGAMLILIKRKIKKPEDDNGGVGDEGFKKWCEENEINYQWANRRMRICRGVIRHENLRHIRSIDILDRVLALPYSKQEAIAVEFTHLDEEGNPKTYKELRPWIVEQIGAQSTRKRMESAPVHRFKKPPPKPTAEEMFTRDWARRLDEENWKKLYAHLKAIGDLAKKTVALCEEMGMRPEEESLPERYYDFIREHGWIRLYAPHVARIDRYIHPTFDALDRMEARKKAKQCDDDSSSKNSN